MFDFKRNYRKYFLRCASYQYPYSAYNINHKAIFVHIPKTAGSSIREVMGAPRLGRLHIDYSHYLRSDSTKFSAYFKFTVIREPVARMQSCFRYLQAGGNQSEEDLILTKIVTDSCVSFLDFVRLVQEQQLHCFWPLLWPQTSFVCDPSGRIMVDQVLRQESLEKDYKVLRRKLPDLPEHLPLLNSSNSSDANECPNEAIKRVKDLYFRDYSIFYRNEIEHEAACDF